MKLEVCVFYAPVHDNLNTKQRNFVDYSGQAYYAPHGRYGAAMPQNAVRMQGT